MIWGEQDTALGKELTYGTEAYVPNLTLQLPARTPRTGCSRTRRKR